MPFSQTVPLSCTHSAKYCPLTKQINMQSACFFLLGHWYHPAFDITALYQFLSWHKHSQTALCKLKSIVIIYEENVWIIKHKNTCLSCTQTHIQHKLCKAGTIFICSIAQVTLSTLFKPQIMTNLQSWSQRMAFRKPDA